MVLFGKNLFKENITVKKSNKKTKQRKLFIFKPIFFKFKKNNKKTTKKFLQKKDFKSRNFYFI